MKKQSIIKLLALSLGLGAICAIPSTQASLLSYESFSGYTVPAELQSAGNPAVTGYTGNWTDVDFGDQEPGTLAGSLDYTGAGYFTETGDRAGVPSNTGGDTPQAGSGRVYRLLDSSLAVNSSTAGTLYMSFLFQRGTGTGSNVYQTLALYDGVTSAPSGPVDQNRNFDIGVNASTTYNFGVESGTGQTNHSTGVTADTGVHLFVVKFTLSATASSDSVTVWLDPTIGLGDPTGGTTVSGRNLTWDRLALSNYDDNSAAWDEIRWGTTIADVVPEPGTFAMLLGGMGMLTLFRRRRA
jgi:hypothetical protein